MGEFSASFVATKTKYFYEGEFKIIFLPTKAGVFMETLVFDCISSDITMS